MQTNVPHIFAVGDINGEGTFTHTSVNDGEIFWDFYSGEDDRTLSERISTYAMFIDPLLGRVGMSEKEARESGRNVLMATRAMKHISRAKEKDETAGLVKILIDADTEQFLGATILGVGGDEIVNMFTTFMVMQVISQGCTHSSHCCGIDALDFGWFESAGVRCKTVFIYHPPPCSNRQPQR
jgi:pyruvate/2-oxoglutarate dehydrogenase complex dihydrolipoamide dehydrogenase (E3) component